MADGRTRPACRTSSLVWRPTANGSGSQLFRRDHLHGPHLDPVAAPAAQELGCGSPASAWRRLNEWAKAGVFEQFHLEVLDRLGLAGRLDWSRASVDSASVRANAGDHVGANPVDRGKPGSKIHLACERSGLPLTAVVTAANVSDVTMLAAVMDDTPAVLTPAGRRPARPGKLDADKGYDSAGNRA
jgi:hypothetical protein